MTTQPWLKMHDAWTTDPKFQRLFAAGRYDAVTLFWALVAHSHAHATDGVLTARDVQSVAHLCSIPARARTLRVLRVAELCRSRGGNVVEIVAYARWQTTSDQRESHADRMRTSRSRARSRDPLEREKEREKAHAAHVPQADDDDLGVISLQKAASERIAELRRKETNGD